MAKKQDPTESEFKEPKNEEESVRRWLDRVKVAERYRNRVAQDAHWERFIDEYKGKYEVNIGKFVAPPINEVYAYIQASISGLYFKDPYIAVNPKKMSTVEAAKILESAVNYYWRELKTKEEIELEIIDTGLVGHGWHKVGTNVSTSGKGDQLKIESEKLYSDRVSWRDVVFNIGSRRPPIDCQWMAHRIVKPTEEVKDMFPKTAAGIKGGDYPSLSKEEKESVMYKDDITYTTLWEIHDAKSKKVYLAAENHYKWLKDPTPWPEYVEEFPLLMLFYNAIPDEPYPLSDISPWEAQLLEKIKVVGMIVNHVKRWNRQVGYLGGSIDEEELDKYERGDDGAMIKFNKDPNSSFKAFDYGSVSQDFYLLIGQLDNMKRIIHGLPEFAFGGVTQTKTRTKGELDLIDSGADARTDRKIDRIETHCENIARHLIKHMQANFDLEKTVKITGDMPEEIIKAFGDKYDPVAGTVTFTKDDIVGEYDVEVKAGSTLALDNKTRIRILDGILEKAVQMAAIPDLPPFIVEIIREQLRNFDMKGLEKAFEEQYQAREAQKIQENAASKVDEDKVRADTDQKLAKAEKLRTDSDVTIAKTVSELVGVGEQPNGTGL